MPYIKVNTNKIKTYTTELENCRTTLNRITQDYSNIRYGLDWDVTASTSVDRRMEQVINTLSIESNSLAKMRVYLQQTVEIYNAQDSIVNEAANDNTSKDSSNTTEQSDSNSMTAMDWLKLGINVAGTFFTTRDAMKPGFNPAQFSKVGKAGLIIGAGIKLFGAGKNIFESWNDDSKTTEKKICDTVANAGCAVLSITASVAGKYLANAAIAAGVAVGGPVLGFVAGVAVNHAVNALSDALTSETVVNQVSDSIEEVVGTVKSGCQAVSDKAKEVAEAQGLDKVGKAAELVGTTLIEGTKIAATAVVETAKVVVTTAVETVKNFFKGW